MAWFHRLDPSYVALISALKGFVFVHSVKEDYYKGPTDGGANI